MDVSKHFLIPQEVFFDPYKITANFLVLWITIICP
nr:MAG TPA: hypothetical protein [Caudoviricetes sp.]